MKYSLYLVLTFLISLCLGYLVGSNLYPIEKIVEIETIAPVMERIKKCESKGQHFDKDGQVLIVINKNNTYDQGVYQINSVWNRTATAIGLNLTNEIDNEKFALWLFENYGSSPWNASAHCWKGK